VKCCTGAESSYDALVSQPRLVTVDAETKVIEAGIATVARLRDEAEERTRMRIPITWFVRFQRKWDEYANGELPAAFAGRFREGFDGFALAADQLAELRERGDEVGWHYHAYNWVHRPDLDRATRLAILRADLAACAEELHARHPDHAVESFRFGWFFVPDPSVYGMLAELGIARDASVDPARAGRPVVRGLPAVHGKPVVAEPRRVDGVTVLPRRDTVVTHDWSVVAHDLGWTQLDEADAAAARSGLAAELVATTRPGGEPMTLRGAEQALVTERSSD
jgi:hypothetical protein